MAIAAARSRREELERASDPAVTGVELLALAQHRDAFVRAAVARREDCPLATLIVLSQDSQAGVQDSLLDNPALPRSVLAALADSRHGRVRKRATSMLAQFAS